MVLEATCVHQWIRAFLTGRRQQVVLDGVTSSIAPVVSGVPQGSVLGPLLFIIYINDLPQHIKHSKVRLFADDCVLYRPIYDNNDTALLQQDIHSLQIWSQDWLMNFNALKCYSMSVTLSRNSIDTTYVTRHEKTGLMYTKYTSSYYGTYLLYCLRY